MQFPYPGAAQPLPADAFLSAADRLGCEPAAIQAVFEVEAAGQFFLSDGSLIRRFEPHKVPRQHWAAMGFVTNGQKPWRASLKVKTREREAMFMIAHRIDREMALRAASFGAPQIMGFNHAAAGFPSAEMMVRAMAESAGAQLEAFVTLVVDWGLDSAIRAQDWRRVEDRYNGGGFGGKYARKMEDAYRRLSGKKSPVILKFGSRGAPVKKLQVALGIEDDGSFGTETDQAVRDFQTRAGLRADGLVGAKTWAALEDHTGAEPQSQKTGEEHLVAEGLDMAKAAIPSGGVGYGLHWFTSNAPEGVLNFAFYGVVGLALAAGALFLFKYTRRAL